MKPLFSVHAGEYLVGSFIEQHFNWDQRPALGRQKSRRAEEPTLARHSELTRVRLRLNP